MRDRSAAMGWVEPSFIFWRISGRGGRLQIQHELGAFGARTADQQMRLARRLVEDRVAVIDLAGDIARQARAAIAEFAGAARLDPMPPQHIDRKSTRLNRS